MTRGHEDRIERVLGHVVQNALDATDGRRPRLAARCGAPAGRRSVEVGDTGAGMSAEDFVRNRLFKPFNTTKSTGMGIGAYESFQYVRELGGSIIGRQRSPASGTVMTILLPLFESRQASDLQLPGEASMSAGRQPPLLIVEDDLALQKQIKWSLDRFESVTASRPRDARWRSSAATSRRW